jgi:HEPN domain-containing protein
VRFSAEDYREASGERLRDAAFAQTSRAYVAAHVNAGLAIECMLRAYRARVQAEFDSRHDLALLADAFLRKMSDKRRAELRDAIANVSILWMNNHRYCSARKLIAPFNKIKRYRTERDMLFRNGERMIGYASLIVQYGEARWNR